MARRRIGVADVKEILVQWEAGEGISTIARALGYTRPTVRKYVQAAVETGLVRSGRRRGEASWERLSHEVVEQVAAGRPASAATKELGRFHAYLGERIGRVRLSVLYQRLRDEQGLT